MLSAAQLADMRETTAAALPDTCTIQAKTIVGDGQGGYSESYSTSATGVACRVKVTDRAPDELVHIEKVQNTLKHVATFAYDRVLNATDRVIWNNQTLEVIASMDNSWQVHKMYFCVKVS